MSRVQSIERAFAVLGALADGPIGVTEVADRVDLPKSTAARLLASLAREGVVEQVPGDTRYRLGPRLVTLAARIRPAGLCVWCPINFRHSVSRVISIVRLKGCSTG